MIEYVKRMTALRMSREALVRRSKLTADVVGAVLTNRADAEPTAVATVRRCLGIGGDGQHLVPARTFRNQAARKKARFIVSMVQGTMGLEAQGLTPADRRGLLRRTYRRLKANPSNLW